MSAAGEQVAQWMQDQSDRALTRQRATADNAKLVATFIAAVAATLVATALQVGESARKLDIASVVALAFGVIVTLAVIGADTICEADHQAILSASVSGGQRWTDEHLLRELRSQSVAAAEGNEAVVRRIRLWLALQVLLALIAGGLAVASLVLPLPTPPAA
jgi:hypothetical protein